MCFVWIWEQTAIISLYNINWPVFINQPQCAHCAVRPGYLKRKSTQFYPLNIHTKPLCARCLASHMTSRDVRRCLTCNNGPSAPRTAAHSVQGRTLGPLLSPHQYQYYYPLSPPNFHVTTKDLYPLLARNNTFVLTNISLATLTGSMNKTWRVTWLQLKEVSACLSRPQDPCTTLN